MMAAVTADGVTVIDNAAREPEITDLAAYLAAMGAGIRGAGSATIEVEGVGALQPAEHTVISDRIEAGTWAAAAVATRGDIVLNGARPDHLELFLEKLAEGGADIRVTDEGLRVRQPERTRAADFVTLPYPGLATDFQPILLAMLATANGTSIATENVFEGRFTYVDELRRMGADIRTEGHHAVIRGVEQLSAAPGPGDGHPCRGRDGDRRLDGGRGERDRRHRPRRSGLRGLRGEAHRARRRGPARSRARPAPVRRALVAGLFPSSCSRLRRRRKRRSALRSW